MKRAWSATAAVAGALLLLTWALNRDAGLRRESVTTSSGAAADRWTGAWNVPGTGPYDLRLEGRGPSSWKIDGAVVNEVANGAGESMRTIWLTSGFHDVEITHEPDPASPQFELAAAPAGERPVPLSQSEVKPKRPRNPVLRRIGEIVETMLRWILAGAILVAIRRTALAIRARWDRPIAGFVRAHGRTAAWVALAFILVFAALLRLDAITARYGPVASPAWLAAVQTRSILPPETLRPAGFKWNPVPLYPHADGIATKYLSDPYTYLVRARKMPSFYDAHDREPMYPYALKGVLYLLHNQDVAVSLTSTAFSLLAIWLTYVLGAMVWSRAAGLVAALGLAIDYDAVSLASAGWRDDVFVAAVVLCAVLTLWCWRVTNATPRLIAVPWLGVKIDAAYVVAIALGLAGAFAILVRAFSALFLIGAATVFLIALRTTWRRRLAVVSLAAVVAALVAGPYFLNCWRVFGDPLYTFNFHANIYRVAEGQPTSSSGTASYVSSKIASRPFEMIDTLALGLTAYPFSNKWHGLEPWWPGVARWAAVAGLAGLLLLTVSAEGRLALFLVSISLVPFAVTWKIDPNWRFTEHAYPLFLIAAAAAALAPVRALVATGWTDLARGLRISTWGTTVRIWAVSAAIALAGVWIATRVLPDRVFAEALTTHGEAGFTAGERDGPFLGRGWSHELGTGSVRTRASLGEGELFISLPSQDDYVATLRVDPFPRPISDSPATLPVLDVVLNDDPLGSVPLRWNPERVGAYDVTLPRASVRRGRNRLVLRVQPAPATPSESHRRSPGLTEGDAFALWYVRVHLVQR